MRIKPLTGQILVRKLAPEDKTTGGLFIPDIAQEDERATFDGKLYAPKKKPFKAVVVRIGPWRKTRNGYGIMPPFGVGATVICSPYSSQQVSRDLGGLALVDSNDVLAIAQEA